MSKLENKTCVVTAAGQGIGRASALAMKAEGATVYACDINKDALSDLEALGLNSVHLDVTNADAVSALAAELGGVDVLFNCAGFVANGTILDCDEDDWRFSNELNVTAMYRMCRAFLPAMIERGG